MPELNIEDVNKALKDSAYAAIGFGVLGFQRAQVRRRELIEQLQSASSRTAVTQQVDAARDQLVTLAKLIEGQIDPAREQVVTYVKQLDKQVSPAREQLESYARKADQQVAPVRQQLHSTLNDVEARLPASTRNTFSAVRKNFNATEDKVRSAVGLPTPAAGTKTGTKASTRKAS